jgi:hypothetical protein
VEGKLFIELFLLITILYRDHKMIQGAQWQHLKRHWTEATNFMYVVCDWISLGNTCFRLL